MENNHPILTELMAISHTVAGITPVNPYEVPVGYFEGLADRILARVKGKDELPDVLKELVSIPYKTPVGYFENFAAETLKKVKANEAGTAQEELEILSPLLSKLNKDKKLPFSIPAGYFNELTDNAVSGTMAIEFVNDELENLSPLMNELKGVNVYNTPVGYFETLPAQLLERAKQQSSAKIIPISFGRKLMRYTAAAVTISAIITAAFFIFNKTDKTTGQTDTAELTKDIQEKTKQASDDDIFSYLEEQNISLAELSITNTTTDLDEEAMQEMLADVSDEELEQYLDLHTDSKQPLTN
jgi:hypothetical protein